MAPILIRCTVHRDLSHHAFSDWLDRRRAELTRQPRGLRHVNASRLGSATWVLELHGTRPHDPDFETAAKHLFADLSLLGMRPDVYVPWSAGADEWLVERDDAQLPAAATGQ
ncbi:MAG TPA: hypothetical protein VFR97_08825 [Capillimicrobium sp.]|nr:hypothetical protein [Capillimicrobium sp.]